jgi:uracil-DNA glycosylase
MTTESLWPRMWNRLRKCRKCPHMFPPDVSGRTVVSKVLLVGRPPATRSLNSDGRSPWTAGKTYVPLVRRSGRARTRRDFRASIYMAAVSGVFPERNPSGGDRVPAPR